jgi:2-keto-4-pentenoate hydratase/2-oxohepta-3-ene-1,7-dioic acid hydratase in catechol pathway
MRIGRLRHGTESFWGLLAPDEASVRRIDGEIADWGPGVTAGGQPPLIGDPLPLAGLQLLPPAQPDAKIVCLGATFAKHVAGLGREMTGQPAGFWKPYSSLVGPEDEIRYPPITEGLDFEVEIVIVVGAPTVDRTNPFQSILGYTIGNDVSLRDLQFAGSVTGMDMFSGKSADSSTPLGPWIVTRDEFGDTNPDLLLSLTVNGETRQSDRTTSMAWPLDFLLVWADERTSLHAGDVVYTGTPDGVGHEDGRYLKPGDLVETTIERLGTQRNKIGPRS